MENGLITEIFNWGAHPSYSEGTTATWLAFLVLILIASFLWSTVIKAIQS